MAEITVSTSQRPTTATRAASPDSNSGHSARGNPDSWSLLDRRLTAVGGSDNRNFGLKFQDLGRQEVDIPAGRQGIHLILVAVAPHDIQGIGSDGAGGTQNGESFHGRRRYPRYPPSYHAAWLRPSVVEWRCEVFGSFAFDL